MPTLDEVREMVAELLGIDKNKINPKADLIKDLGADSLDLVELIMALEEKFNLKIFDEDTDKLVTVQDVVNYIDSMRVTR